MNFIYMKINKSFYKDIPSTVLENESLKVQILPEIGAKISSIYSKKHDYEFLVQAPGKKYRKQNYEGTYVLGECSGFDDMFPTIDRCYYGEYPWAGTPLPEAVSKGITIFSKSGRIGGYGDEFDWPGGKAGTAPADTRLDISRPAVVGDMEKYYLKEPLSVGRCELRYPDGKRFCVEFSPETVPYLGILMNENGWNNDGEWDSLYNIFLEPCTASFDRIDAAKLRNRCSLLPAKSEYCWDVSIKID